MGGAESCHKNCSLHASNAGRQMFSRFSGSEDPKAKFGCEKFKEVTKQMLTPELAESLFSVLEHFAKAENENAKTSDGRLTYPQFVSAMKHVLKEYSSMEDRATIIVMLCSLGKFEKTTQINRLKGIVQEVLKVFTKLEVQRSKSQPCHFNQQCRQDQIVEFFIHDLDSGESGRDISVDEIEHWLSRRNLLASIMDAFFDAIFSSNTDPTSVLPEFTGVTEEITSLLSIEHFMILNQNVPKERQKLWRLLYKSDLHGLSFSTLMSRIINQGPTICVFRDNDGFMFGGYASDAWSLRPTFFGDEQCFLFTLVPKIGIYPASGYNKNFCYMNVNQVTLPNGMGMGGQIEIDRRPVHYFSLWLYDVTHGKSQKGCVTFNSPQLSAAEEFTISAIEIWALGTYKPPLGPEYSPNRSILDADPQAQAVLEMAGKTRHSEGIREPEKYPEDGN